MVYKEYKDYCIVCNQDKNDNGGLDKLEAIYEVLENDIVRNYLPICENSAKGRITSLDGVSPTFPTKRALSKSWGLLILNF
jgi:hypothetical protein